MGRRPMELTRIGAAYGRATAAVVAFLAVGVLVKYAELLLTYEHRPLIEPQGTIASRVEQIWLALQFSWQEFAIASVLLAAIAAWRRIAPSPGRASRAAMTALQLVLVVSALTGVFGIAYYAIYHAHMTLEDFEHIGWATEIAGSANLFQYRSITLLFGLLAILFIGLPWLWVRLSGTMQRRLEAAGLVLAGSAAILTAAIPRPLLAQASLEPNPALWLLFGERPAYRDLPPLETLATIGPRDRKYEVSERPRNVILLVLESTPAHTVAGYAPEARGGRRLFSMFPNDVTLFENIFCVTPGSVPSLISVLTGRSPIPSNDAALRATANTRSLPQVLKTRGYQTHFLKPSPSDGVIDELLARGFDRAWTMDAPWPGKESYARLTWGYDDRLLFDEARRFLAAQTPSSPPFLLMLYPISPHHPYPASAIPGLEGHPDDKVRHARLVEYLIDSLTDMYAWMKQTGLADSTVVLAYGDHGQAFGEHPGNYIHGTELFRENVHVPMLLLHPRRLGLPPRISQLGSLDDVMPTALDLLGIPSGPGSGMSLLDEAPGRTLFMLTNWGAGQIAFRDSRFFYLLSRTGRELLFDQQADREERENVAGRHPEVAANFRSRLKPVIPSP